MHDGPVTSPETETSSRSPQQAGRGTYNAGRREIRARVDHLFDSSLAFRPRMSGSVWAERYGRIPKGTGAESGPVTLYGYQRGLLDAMCDPRIPQVTVLKAARVGYTRCFTLALGYHLHHAPTLCTIAQPTIPDAEEFGGTEIAPHAARDAGPRRPHAAVPRKGEKPDKATFYQLTNGASVAPRRGGFGRRLPTLLGLLHGGRRDRRRGVDARREDAGRQAQALLDARRDLLQPQARRRVDATARGDVAGLASLAAERPAPLLRALPTVRRGAVPRLGRQGTSTTVSSGRSTRTAGWPPSGTRAPAAASSTRATRPGWMPAASGGRRRCRDRRGMSASTSGQACRSTRTPPGRRSSRSGSTPRTIQPPLSSPSSTSASAGPTGRATGRSSRAIKFLGAARGLRRRGAVAGALPHRRSRRPIAEGKDPRIEVAVYGWGDGLECWLIGHCVLQGRPRPARGLGQRRRPAEPALQARRRFARGDPGGGGRLRWSPHRRDLRLLQRAPPQAGVGHQGPVRAAGQARHGVAAQAVREARVRLVHDRRQRGPRLGLRIPRGRRSRAPACVHFPQIGAAGSREIDEDFFAAADAREAPHASRVATPSGRSPRAPARPVSASSTPTRP